MGTAHRKRRLGLDDLDPARTVLRDGGIVGRQGLRPFTALVVTDRELRMRWLFGSEVVTRSVGGHVEYDEHPLGTGFRLADDRGTRSIRLVPRRPSRAFEALRAARWEVVARSVRSSG